MTRALGVFAFLVLGVASPALGRTVEGRVFVDTNGDGLFSVGELGVASVVVFWETTLFEQTDADGYFSLDVPDEDGIVWARTPQGYLPGSNWQRVQVPGDVVVDLPLDPDLNNAPFSFAVASDTHVGIASFVDHDVDTALQQTASIFPRPHFLVVTGDISQSNEPGEFERVLAQAELLPFAYVPVPGNHDWYDGGDAYRLYFGPPTYSFDSGGLHFVILNDAASLQDRADFLARDLMTVEETTPVVALMHSPPGQPLLQLLADFGVDHLFTGHQHANRVLQHDTLLEYNTQPLGMGGIDHTPAGFRVVTTTENGDISIAHRTIVDAPLVRLMRPGPSDILPRCEGTLLAAVESTGAVVEVSARIDGGDQPMTHVGGWVYRAEIPDPCRIGSREVVINAVEAGGQAVSHTQQIQIADCVAGRVSTSDWSQFQGSPTHTGESLQPIEPPLRSLWTVTMGAHLQGGAPVVSNGRVFVSLVDYGDASDGGIAALDASTGDELWRHQTGYAVRHSPAVVGNTVVVAVNDGTVLGLSAQTGRQRWSYTLAERPDVDPVRRNSYGAPTVVDNVAYIGIKRELVALDIKSGDVVWSVAPFDTGGETSTYSSPAISEGVIVQSFSRGTDGLVAYDQTSGDELWRTAPDVSFHLNSSPIIASGKVFAVNESVEVTALDLHTGELLWSLPLSDETFPWSFSAMATGAMYEQTMFLATQYGTIHAVDTAGGVELWRVELATPGVVRTSHYRGELSAVSASLVVAGGVVWVGTTSGLLIALDPVSGALIWQTDIGAPLLTGPVPAGELLVVGTYDGTIRAFVTEEAACVPYQVRSDGCGCSGHDAPSAGSTLVLIVIASLLAAKGAKSARDQLQ